MKVIRTAHKEEREASWEEIENFLQEGIYQDIFLTLYDTKHPNFICIEEMGDRYMAEIRLYKGDKQHFQQFRKYFNVAEDSVEVFKAFFHEDSKDIIRAFFNNKAFVYQDWEDITDEVL